MKKFLMMVMAAMLAVTAFEGSAQGYKLDFKIEGLNDSAVYLANYFGAKQYFKDTTAVKPGGQFTFQGEEALECGIYLVVMGDKATYFEIIVGNDQEVSFSTSRSDMVNKMKVTGSVENQKFYEYLIELNAMTKDATSMRARFKNMKEDDKDYKSTKEKLTKVDKQVNEYRVKFIEENPDLLICKVFMGSKDPEVPAPPAGLSKDEAQTWRWAYYKKHYWDNFDLADDCMIRTPVYHQRLKNYFEKVVVQNPDSLVEAAKTVMALIEAGGKGDLFKYTVHYLTNKYETSKIMCVDKVFVYMAQKYYCTREAFWADSATCAKICERANTLEPLQCGKIAPNLILQDTTGGWHSLHRQENKYTILYFWDSGCGHCKKKTPKLVEYYDKVKDKGIGMYAVGTEFETDEWKKFIREKDLHWLNISDNPEYPNGFRDVYDIYSTPVLYILDEKKEIIGKRLDVEQLEDFMEQYQENQRKIEQGKDLK